MINYGNAILVFVGAFFAAASFTQRFEYEYKMKSHQSAIFFVVAYIISFFAYYFLLTYLQKIY